MKIYRIEHKKKRGYKFECFAGPYGLSNVVSCFDWAEREHISPTHPCPDQDPLIVEAMNKNPNYVDFQGIYHCGFCSMEQLERWFSRKELSNLKELGFVIGCYEADDVVVGETQVLFVPRGRRRITQIAI